MKNQNILIVDDGLDATKILIRQLSSHYSVFSVSSTTEALDIVPKENIKLIISDHKQSKISGLDFFTAINKTHPFVCKVLLIEDADIDLTLAALNDGMNFQYLKKPYTIAELLYIIKQSLEKYELSIQDSILTTHLEDMNLNSVEKINTNTKDFTLLQNELTTSKEYFRAVFEDSTTAIAIIDADTTFCMVNNTYCKLSGYSKEEIIGTSWTKQIPPEDLEKLKEYNRLREINPSHLPEKYEFSFYHKNGEIRHCIMSVSIIANTKKKFASFLDITERIRNEKKIIESEKRYSNLLKHLETGIVVHAPDTSIVMSNPRASEILGLTFEQLKGKVAIDPDWKFIDIDNKPLSIENYPVNRIVNSKKPLVNQIIGINQSDAKNIVWVTVNGFPKLNENNEIAEIVVSFNDISERIIAEKELKESEEKFKKAFMTSPDSININRMEDGMYISINSGFTQIMGYTEEEILGKTSIEKNIWVDSEDRKKLNERLNEKGFVENLVSIFRKKNGEMVYGMMSASIIELDGIKHILSITRDINDLKESEKALQESEEKFRNVFEYSVVGKSIALLDGRMKVNKAFSDIVGYSKKELSEIKWEAITHKDDLEYNFKVVDRLLKGETNSERWEKRYIHKDGHIVWIDISITLQRNEKGQPLYIITTINDISEKKKAEKELRESEKRFKTLFEKAPLAYQSLNKDGKIINVNETWVDALGYKKEDISGKWFGDFVTEKSLENFNSSFYKLKELGRYQSEFELIKKDGSIITAAFVGRSSYNSDGEFTQTHAVFQDITEQRKTEKSLAESERRFRELLSTVKVVSVLLDLNGNITFCNDFTLELTHRTKEEVIGKNWFDLFIADDIKEEIKKVFANSIQSTEPLTAYENQILTKEKEEILVSWTNTWLFDSNGNINGIASLGIDVTEQREAELSVRKSKNRLNRAEFASMSGNWELILGTNTIKASKGAHKLYGVNKGEFNYEGIKKIPLPEYRPLMDKALKDLIEKNIPYDIDYKIKRPNTNEIRDIHSSAKFDKEKQIAFGVIRDITEQKIAENQIKELNYKYNLILNSAGEGIIGLNKKGNHIFYNQAALDNLNYTPEEFFGESGHTLWHHNKQFNEEFSIKDCYIHDTLKSGKTHQINNELFYRKDGSSFPVEYISSPIIENGNITGAVVTFKDITELKKAEQALIKNKNLLSDTEKIGKVGGWEFNIDTLEQIWTEEIYNIHELPYTFENSIEEGINYYTPECIPIIERAVERAIKYAEPYDLELEIITAKGNRKNVHSVGKIDTENRRIYGFIQDITERKRAERALNESEEKLSALFSGMSEMVVIHELIFDQTNSAVDYKIIDCNESFTSITGIKKEEAIGKLATELYQTDKAPYLDEYASVCVTAKNLKYKTYFEPMDKHFLISAVCLGKNRFATITADITDIQKAQEALVDKNKELENYMYIASHDLRSPLVNIQGFSQRLERQTVELKNILLGIEFEKNKLLEIESLINDKLPKSLNYILNNVSKMDKLISGLLQLSRTGRVEISIKQLHMSEFIKNIIAAFNFQLSECNASVKIGELNDCYGDEALLNQVFSNIISNAIKYRTKDNNLQIEINSKKYQNKIIYSIKDNGIGIDKNYLNKIWNVFYRVDPNPEISGEGLGLSLVKRIIEKHKGQIWVESTPGIGSVFYFELQQKEFAI